MTIGMRFSGRRAALLGGATAAALVAAGCGSTTSSSPAGTASTPETPSSTPAATPGATATSLTLVAQDFSFAPTALQVAPGATVTLSLQNTGKAKHNFTADAVKSNLDLDPGTTSTATFTAPASGTIAFHCEYHPAKMLGTITVAAAETGGSRTGATTAPAPATPHVTRPSSSTGY